MDFGGWRTVDSAITERGLDRVHQAGFENIRLVRGGPLALWIEEERPAGMEPRRVCFGAMSPAETYSGARSFSQNWYFMPMRKKRPMAPE